jgi:hypothetical protein
VQCLEKVGGDTADSSNDPIAAICLIDITAIPLGPGA